MREPHHLPRPFRLALTPTEAAQALGCSRDFFDAQIGPELRWVRHIIRRPSGGLVSALKEFAKDVRARTLATQPESRRR